MNKLRKIKRILFVYSLIRKAKKEARKTGKRQYVIMLKGYPTIINEWQFANLRQRGHIPYNHTLIDLKRISIYYTGQKNDKKRIQRVARTLQTKQPSY